MIRRHFFKRIGGGRFLWPLIIEREGEAPRLDARGDKGKERGMLKKEQAPGLAAFRRKKRRKGPTPFPLGKLKKKDKHQPRKKEKTCIIITSFILRVRE